MEGEKKLDALLAEYMKWVGIHNFTAHREEKRFAELNILDSILPLQERMINIGTEDKVLDLGTGGGFPGVPLALLNPESDVHLIDSVGKKLKMIEAIASQLSIENITTHNGRIETLAQDKLHREQYDVVVSKALAKWHTLLEYTLPFVAVGGAFYAYQSTSIFDEIEESMPLIERLGGMFVDIYSYELPGDYGTRTIVAIEKVDETPSKFPREVGVPKKIPLQ